MQRMQHMQQYKPTSLGLGGLSFPYLAMAAEACFSASVLGPSRVLDLAVATYRRVAVVASTYAKARACSVLSGVFAPPPLTCSCLRAFALLLWLVRN